MAVLGHVCTGIITAVTMVILGYIYTNLSFVWGRKEKINRGREISSSNPSRDDNGASIISSLPVVTTHDNQESTNSPQVEMPMPSAKVALEGMLKILFEEVCFGFGMSGFFDSLDAPSLFVIYAHDNPTLGKADSRMVRELIRSLGEIKSKCRSDRNATLGSDAPKSRARDDILENQFCILPKSVSDTSVDKIVLFYSEALQACCTNVEGRKYIDKLKTVDLHTSKESGYGTHDTVFPSTSRSTREKLRAVVESHSRQPWFHHVLTEIGLVSLRTAWDRDPYTVVAVNIHDIETISDDLEFLGHTQHYLSLPPPEAVLINEAERYHHLFFGLLERIYNELPMIVDLIRQHYQAGLTSLREGQVQSHDVFKMTIRYEIMGDIKRIGTYRPAQSKTPMDHSGNGVPPLHHQRDILNRLNCTARTLSPPQESRQGLSQGPLNWLTTHPAYSEWLSRDGGMLGLRGGPGVGKTTAINHLLQRSRSAGAKNCINLTFSFPFGGESTDISSVGMYSTLLYELLSEHPQYGIEFWKWMDEHRSTEVPPYASHLRELLLLALKRAIKEIRVRIFLDELDLAGDREAREIIADLRYITSASLGIPKGLSICFACRSYPTFSVDNGPEIDLGEYFRNHVVPPRNSTSCYQLYRDILDKTTRREPIDLAIMMMLLQFIRFSRRGLSLQELRTMLASNKQFMQLIRRVPHGFSEILQDDIAMMDTLTRYLGQLAQVVDIIDESGNIRSVINFIHISVVDWLFQSDEMARIFKIPTSSWIGTGHHFIAAACYTSVRTRYRERDILSVQDSEARFGYAIDFWFDHAARADAEGFSQAYFRTVLVEEDGRSLLQTWASDYMRRNPGGHVLPPTPSLEDIAEIFGIPSLLKDRP